jgi:hypothetical protein
MSFCIIWESATVVSQQQTATTEKRDAVYKHKEFICLQKKKSWTRKGKNGKLIQFSSRFNFLISFYVKSSCKGGKVIRTKSFNAVLSRRHSKTFFRSFAHSLYWNEVTWLILIP